MQLAGRTGRRQLEELFSPVGEMRDIRVIADRNSRRSKGIAYVEFRLVDSVDKALKLNGTKVEGIPIMIQRTQSEKNKIAALQAQQKAQQGPTRLYIGSLHYNINEDMLRAIFEPFGLVENVNIIRDSDTNVSKGYGFIQYKEPDSARRALEQLNGLEVAGRPIKVGTVTDRSADLSAMSALDDDDTERGGIEMNSLSRVALMAKLSQTHNATTVPVSVPVPVPVPGPTLPATGLIPAANTVQASPCFLISNMFDPAKETDQDWDLDIRDDIIEECNKHGNVYHVYVDKTSPKGIVYVKCQTIDVAARAVKSLNGRWFAGNMITAQFLSLASYHTTFPQAANANTPLKPSAS
ncbi:uncharacterized protein TRIADDRAFT_37071 [Trichoplax adhaerens]|uniref:RRM domain-containing protein n=1 Tax=Trichoplax adhaerens TaxID=10228 RepID=B3RJ64_TRIAD|nr:hypothetical protein TRIADDRAFT_37071 [Trichoplax adhaerens]EDV29072.1 hypothetical protein TRIADDRAFT_37071 [Trichoplax adhaerens]|eukprot:XP_002108274.1 hypothetical protein TRIADDRAFT_37071 [Trichoplax adhaerens]